MKQTRRGKILNWDIGLYLCSVKSESRNTTREAGQTVVPTVEFFEDDGKAKVKVNTQNEGRCTKENRANVYKSGVLMREQIRMRTFPPCGKVSML